MFRRFLFKGKKEQLPEIEAVLKKEKVSRKTMYLILKYFEINPDAVQTLEEEFPDV